MQWDYNCYFKNENIIEAGHYNENGKFVKLMTGHFDNREQFTEMKSAGKLFPYARHVNTVCNDKINNIPAGEDKNTFSYASMKNVEYSDLKRSEKFTPALYQEKDGVWEGGSVSQFTPVMTFRLWERFSETCLEVSESMEVNGKKTFGYDVPVIYKRERGA